MHINRDPSSVFIAKNGDFGGLFYVLPTMNRVWAHLGLPPYPVNDAEAKNTRSYDTMDEHIKTYLRAFYVPHNRKLNTLLQSTHDKWNDPWSNDS